MDVDCIWKFSDETLETYALGRLADPAGARFEEHLLTCRFCQDRLAETDEYILAASKAAAMLVKDRPGAATPFLVPTPERAA